MKTGDSYPLGVPPAVLRTLLLRLFMLMVFVASVGLIWWSINRLAPLEKRIEEGNGRIAGLENDILQMELRWDADEAVATEAQFNEASGLLFSGQDEITMWQEDIKSSHGDILRVNFGPPTVRTLESPMPNRVFTTTEATLDLQPIQDESIETTPYERLLELTETLTTDKRRVDLLELTARGTSNSVSHARLLVRVWSQDPAPKP
ncbi:MAG TPA: hypothetical protein VMS21_08300 [Methylomirabilota bacterium]|nr:hypothetical protein [Methylomirabilota bacterium]